MNILKPDQKNSILLVLLMVIAFSIPFHNTFSSVSIALFVLFWVIESSPGAKLKRMLQPAGSHYVIGFSLIFFSLSYRNVILRRALHQTLNAICNSG